MISQNYRSCCHPFTHPFISQVVWNLIVVSWLYLIQRTFVTQLISHHHELSWEASLHPKLKLHLLSNHFWWGACHWPWRLCWELFYLYTDFTYTTLHLFPIAFCCTSQTSKRRLSAPAKSIWDGILMFTTNISKSPTLHTPRTVQLSFLNPQPHPAKPPIPPTQYNQHINRIQHQGAAKNDTIISPHIISRSMNPTPPHGSIQRRLFPSDWIK